MPPSDESSSAVPPPISPAGPVRRRLGAYAFSYEPTGTVSARADQPVGRGISLDHGRGVVRIGALEATPAAAGPRSWVTIDDPREEVGPRRTVELSAAEGLGRLAANLLGQLTALCETIDPRDAAPVLDALFLLARQAVSPEAGAEPQPEPTEPRAEALRLIEAHLGRPELDAVFLAGELGLSRATLYRMFKNLGGVNGYIRRQRLEKARKALTDGDASASSVAQVAEAHGFVSEAQFRRAYAAAFGTPAGS